MPLSFTPLFHLKRRHVCDQCHASWESTFLPIDAVNSVQTRKVHTLDLSGLKKVVHVWALGGCTNLNLSACRNITDVSALGGVRTVLSQISKNKHLL
jgi:hypothetical protein